MATVTTDLVRFIGVYFSFPFNNDFAHWGALARRFVVNEAPTALKKVMVHYRRTERQGTFKLKEGAISRILDRFGQGDFTYIHASSEDADTDWINALTHGVTLDLYAQYIDHPLKPSPIHDRFGLGGSITITYPLDRFEPDEETNFQRVLVKDAKDVFCQLKPNWGFINLGLRLTEPPIVGSDYEFQQTMDMLPETSFDYDIRITHPSLYREFVRGAFWANFLNEKHISALGGMEVIRAAKPCSIIEELECGRLLLQTRPSPLSNHPEESAKEYQRLRKFMKPILLETVEDVVDLQESILGKEEFDRQWKATLANKKLRKILK